MARGRSGLRERIAAWLWPSILIAAAASCLPAHAAPPPVMYGPLPEEVAEICQPRVDLGARPAILLIHGGGWVGGDKATLSQRCHLLAGYGYSVVNINYRLANGTPNHSWPAALEDAHRALAWILKNADSLGVDKKRIGVIGESSGGQLALLLGQNGGVRCVVSESAPTDLLTAPSFTSVISPLVFTSKPIEDDYRTASPVIGVGKASAPTMIVHGRSDDLVPFSQGQELQGALRRNKVPVVMLPYEGGHIMQNTKPEERARVISAEMVYLKRYLSPDDGFGNLR